MWNPLLYAMLNLQLRAAFIQLMPECLKSVLCCKLPHSGYVDESRRRPARTVIPNGNALETEKNGYLSTPKQPLLNTDTVIYEESDVTEDQSKYGTFNSTPQQTERSKQNGGSVSACAIFVCA